MCIPAGALAVVTAIGSAVAGSVQSIAAYTQAQQETNYANAVAQRQYEAQQQAYRQSEQAYAEQVRLNREAANRGYVSEQQKLQAEYRQAAEKAQQLSIQSLRQQGTILSSGRTGQSIGLLMADPEKQMGRDLATLGQNLGYAQQDYFTSTTGIFNELQSAQNVAQSNRMIQPTAPIGAPGPSALGLVGGIGGSIMGGVSSYASLKSIGGPEAPKPKPAPKPKG